MVVRVARTHHRHEITITIAITTVDADTDLSGISSLLTCSI